MIVRILGQGQWVMEPEQLISLNEIDVAVERAVAENDAEGLKRALEQLADGVRAHGTEVPDEVIAESDLVLPDADASLEEVKALLDGTKDFYGLIPDAENFESEGETIQPDTGFEAEAAHHESETKETDVPHSDPLKQDGTETTGIVDMDTEEMGTEADGETGEVSESNDPQITDAPPTDVDATPEMRDHIDSLGEVLPNDGFSEADEPRS